MVRLLIGKDGILMSDLISRQDAIDAINAYLGLSAVSRTIQNMTSIQEILENLPSAEPEIIRCRDCKHHDGIRCFRWNSTIITGFDDFCSNAERRR